MFRLKDGGGWWLGVNNNQGATGMGGAGVEK